jgi:hypothetical protein
MKNKPKKLRGILLIAAFCLLNTVSYGQTKAETISWLNEKLTACLLPDTYQGKVELVSINECEFVIKYIKETVNGTKQYVTYTIPTNNVGIDEDNYFRSDLSIIKIYDSSRQDSHYGRWVSEIKVRECETDIYLRIEKALVHLATFCPKKKEAF